MIINEQTLIRLPVVTKSGEKLGHIIDIEFDIDTHSVRKYLVGARFRKEIYFVAPVQIISIEEDKILVEDGVLKNVEKGSVRKNIIRGGLDAVLPTTIDN